MGLIRRALASPAVAKVTSPHHPDEYLTLVHPMLTVQAVRGRVVEVIRETGAASTVVMRPNGAWTGFVPGQHVEFGVEVDGTRRVRVFSVSSSAERKDGLFSVSVKAHPDGYVSQFLHAGHLKPGTVVYLSPASGDFVLPKQVPGDMLLISGGSGITPVMSMLRTLADRGHTGHVTFLHYARSREDEMFSTELDALGELPFVDMVRVYTRDPEPGADLVGRITLDHLRHLGIDPLTTPTWVCGPAGLIATVRDLYEDLGAQDQLTAEYFKVPSVDLDAADATGSVTFEASGVAAPNSGTTILEQAEAAGLSPTYGCRMGVCNTCAVKKLHGAVRHVISGEVCADTDETIKVCVNVPVGDVAVDL
ncbi:2Fe-2S iron-sulfur cluster binding domain-containing protein [Aeromicrobium sp. 636]|uniref:Ferredoxin reductase n=1 Tax=Aeromicrobium senzhongii TaxID=2663859 RepID=A0A8I0K094_9ACTN|nr:MULTISPECIES: ferredoxin reductase [Aeromicrobium]MBC9225533.1 ferredoxin reductase [Aeromicrobium senzhongii]MCQ3997643.1 2Fe-2S iron-sulfur cluster binding domain-containing protein [Aeromicrobium sp. 636]MTB87570.1 2Fe-2S iron-sulfur cluster binding domain-containing protein [Aeromicrobium senzhongii]QNL95389.1 ferredoxin reductase [Aeromicrobium senzhongii]